MDDRHTQVDQAHVDLAFSTMSIGAPPTPPVLPMPPPPGSGTSDRDASPVREPVCVKSSLGISFMVISDNLPLFLKSQSATDLALETDINAAHSLVNKFESAEGLTLLTDFEGENMGWGGVLETAQFLPTKIMNPVTLHVECITTPDTIDSFFLPGLLVDARGPKGAGIIKRIMESNQIIKLIWGADGDCASLCHQDNLQIRPVHVVDVQLAYSSPGKRLGMAGALERVPQSFIKDLPSKQSNPSKYSPQAFNKRCNVLPCGREDELYAMDDLHRILAIISTKPPSMRSFSDAKAMTDQLISNLQNPTGGLAWLRQESGYYNRKHGMVKSQKAVQFARACVHIELVFGATLNTSEKQVITDVKKMIAPELRRIGVVVTDLSFVGD